MGTKGFNNKEEERRLAAIPQFLATKAPPRVYDAPQVAHVSPPIRRAVVDEGIGRALAEYDYAGTVSFSPLSNGPARSLFLIRM